MDKNLNKIVISLSANKQKSITLRSPNIDEISTLSKHSRSPQSYVTPENQKKILTEATIDNKETDNEKLERKPWRKIQGNQIQDIFVLNMMNHIQQIMIIIMMTNQQRLMKMID